MWQAVACQRNEVASVNYCIRSGALNVSFPLHNHDRSYHLLCLGSCDLCAMRTGFCFYEEMSQNFSCLTVTPFLLVNFIKASSINAFRMFFNVCSYQFNLDCNETSAIFMEAMCIKKSSNVSNSLLVRMKSTCQPCGFEKYMAGTVFTLTLISFNFVSIFFRLSFALPTFL